MKNVGLPIGDVNLRFSCCTYLAYTKTTPSYCRKFDNIGIGLIKYCREKDWQGYYKDGEDSNGVQGRRRMNVESVPWWHDDSSALTNTNFAFTPSLLSVDVIKEEVMYQNLRVDSSLDPTNVLSNRIDFDFAETFREKEDKSDGNHWINIYYDSGYIEQYQHRVESKKISVPPLDLYNETRIDDQPSAIFQPNTQIRMIIDGLHGNVTKVELIK